MANKSPAKKLVGLIAEEWMGQKEIPVDEMTYEQALAELEEITRQLEENPPALAQTLVLYERGQSLAKRCSVLLDQAELKIRQLSGEELDQLAGE